MKIKNMPNKLTTEEFIQKAKSVHGDKYDYSLVDYKNNKTKVKIICPIHGVFEQIPNNHLKENNMCLKCFLKKRRLTTEQFIEKAKSVHGDKYDYSLVDYINTRTKVKIICPIHGVFEQTTNNHLNLSQGCPICSESKGENLIRKYLIENNIDFIYQKRFKNCRNKNPLPFDFYLPDYNTCIEFDGIQHFEEVSFGSNNKERLTKTQMNDSIKNKFCVENNINLIRIKYNEVIEDKLEQQLKLCKDKTVDK